ncbi:aminoacyl--tRNA ligase-related protein [Vitreimonas flagellata]|uniref:aminoacyl--tRNA ligase-related protein n=1 Tax=Vitreimonas flagellata TaxID=2560861 RepID=UPI001074F038|nr:aminoacyl--tRNA ligase-related protein [Vitreimonas flagellata]
MHALRVTRAQDFPEWYQTVVRDADLAELSPTRGSMIIKPWGMGLWERIQGELDRRIKDAGHDNYYFPLLIPLSFFAKEAEHVDGFAKEMAVVTHHRLKQIDGVLKPDPGAELTEPLIIRPTSETIIGDAFSRWVKSYRDLPLKLNQWANVMRWEMRTRMFLRTAEFLWQEGHTVHVDEADAMVETMWALELYRSFSEDYLAMPVIHGEKPENERFPGAVRTYSIEAMMQDGKALQAGTSHYLGTHFAEAQNIRYQDKEGGQTLAHTTSWGMSTRMIGGVIMTHGDDDGLRTPPAAAPRQIVIVPMLRGKPEDSELKEYCASLVAELNKLSAFGWPVRAYVDIKDAKPADKRWDWVRRGAPLICEIGPRDAANGQVTFIKRNALRQGDKIKSHSVSRVDFVAQAAKLLEETQAELYAEAKARMDNNIRADFKTFADLEAYYGTEDKEGEFKGWARVHWARPTGDALEKVGERLKALKLTIRNAPASQPSSFGTCMFSGEQAVEEILIARAY